MRRRCFILNVIVIFFILCILFSTTNFTQEIDLDINKESEQKRKIAVSLDSYPDLYKFSFQDVPCPETKGLSKRLWKETKNSFTGWGLLGLTAGIGAAGIAYSKDEKIRDWFQEQPHLGESSKYGEVLGQGYTHVAIDFGFLIFGKMFDNQRMVETSKALAEGLLLNALATHALKYSVRRKRPGGDSRNSFPSAHASGAFLTATVISGMYDWDWKAVVPCYLLATFAGVSRLEDDYHWASDVVFGAALGTIIGVSVSKCHNEKLKNLTVTTTAGPNGGIAIKYSW